MVHHKSSLEKEGESSWLVIAIRVTATAVELMFLLATDTLNAAGESPVTSGR